jgi:hypothetical protein
VPDDAPHPDGLLARRLDHLFRTVHPADRKAFTPADVATAINEAAAEFFGVSPTYFFDDTAVERGAMPPEVVAALQDDTVRDIALRAAGLSEDSLKVIAETVGLARERDEARRRRPRGQAIR